jgi:ABC-type dipeptide/oligopeptide/nickel transport system ATPase subunit
MNEEENVKKNVALKKIIDKSLELISDRLENGDYVFDQKTGEVKRKPVGLRDLSKVANEMMVQQAETAKVNAPTTSKQTIEEALKKIATEFANLARGVANDQENRQRLPSEVRVGEEFVEAGADESSGGETFEASGVLQAPEEEINGA